MTIDLALLVIVSIGIAAGLSFFRRRQRRKPRGFAYFGLASRQRRLPKPAPSSDPTRP